MDAPVAATKRGCVRGLSGARDEFISLQSCKTSRQWHYGRQFGEPVQSEAEAFAQSAAEPDFAEGLSGLHREARTDIQRKYLTRTETGRRLMLPGSNSISLVASFLATTTIRRTRTVPSVRPPRAQVCGNDT